MIKEYVFDERRSKSYPVSSSEELRERLNKLIRFGAWSKVSSYDVVLAIPQGIIRDEMGDQQYMYMIYGVAAEDDKHHALLGRKIPTTQNYLMPPLVFLESYGHTDRFVVSNELEVPTSVLVGVISPDYIMSIGGIIVDHKERLVLLTTFMPSQITEEMLTPVEEGGSET